MNEIIWRYLDFTKFVALLDKSALFFARADSFDDPFEGSWTKKNFDSLAKSFEGYVDHPMPKFIRKFFKKLRKYTFINCWQISNHESAAMWELYLESNKGVAIRSSISRLQKELKKKYSEKDLYISKVQYVDYSTRFMPEGNLLAPFIHKRESFEHEREVRAIIQKIPIGSGTGDTTDWGFEPPEKGIAIPVDLNAIIETLYISPTSPKWFKELTQSIISKYGYNIPVKQSSLLDDPIF